MADINKFKTSEAVNIEAAAEWDGFTISNSYIC